MGEKNKSVSRRWLLIGGIGVAISAVLGFLLSRPKKEMKIDLIARKVDKLPIKDPLSDMWFSLPDHEVELFPQNILKPIKSTKSIDKLIVKAAYDDEWIGFRLEWKDRSRENRIIKIDEFRDSCAVMLINYPTSGLAWRMGAVSEKATIIQWRSEWQSDIEEGFQDLEKSFPNISIDSYPFMSVNGVENGKPKNTLDLVKKGDLWFVGTKVGNLSSEIVRKVPVEKLVGMGPGTLTSLPTQDAEGWGVWRDGKWRVVLAKKLNGSDYESGELRIAPSNRYSIAFAVWNGSVGDRGSRKSISRLFTLYVE